MLYRSPGLTQLMYPGCQPAPTSLVERSGDRHRRWNATGVFETEEFLWEEAIACNLDPSTWIICIGEPSVHYVAGAGRCGSHPI
jgi:hypothetical protein